MDHDKNSWEKCKALLFDKDGTILDFRLMWLGWCREVVRKLEPAFKATAVEKCLSCWGVDLALGSIKPDGHLAIGSRSELLQSLSDQLVKSGCSIKKPDTEVLKAMQQAYRSVETKGLIRPIAGVTETIEKLYEKGYKLAVVTTDDTEKALLNMQMVGLDLYFDVIIGCDKVSQCKPAPDLAFEACRLLKVNPAEAAVIGDTVADLQMGKAAGLKACIGVASGVTNPALLKPYADLILESAADLIIY